MKDGIGVAMVAFALIVFTTLGPLFMSNFAEAAPKSLRNGPETKTAPQIVRFVGKTGGHCVDVDASEQEALARANVWIRNTPRIRIISLSVAGNYYGESVACPVGYSSVTILYEAK